MSYYPLSQIKTNLYSDPLFPEGIQLLVESDLSPYRGYYWVNSKGEYFSGKTPQDLPSVPLVVNFDSSNEVIVPPTVVYDYSVVVSNDYGYNLVKNITAGNPDNYQAIPAYTPMLPTSQDYQIGEFRRYFCKKTNEIQYVEINKDQFDLLVAKDPQILWQLYFPFFIPWDITGNKEQVARTNKNIVDLTMKNLRLPRFNDYLKNDYTKYYK